MIRWIVRFFAYLIAAEKAQRSCWVWCPGCGRDLNGDDESFFSDDGAVVEYHCATCGAESTWDFGPSTPFLMYASRKLTHPGGKR